MLPLLGQSLLPSFKERDFLMHWVTAPGTSLAEETRITTRANAELLAIPGVRNAGSHIGQAFLSDEMVGVNSVRTGSASTPPSTTTRRSPRSRRWSTGIRGSGATC